MQKGGRPLPCNVRAEEANASGSFVKRRVSLARKTSNDADRHLFSPRPGQSSPRVLHFRYGLQVLLSCLLNDESERSTLAQAAGRSRHRHRAAARRSGRAVAGSAAAAAAAAAAGGGQAQCGREGKCSEEALPLAPCPKDAAKAEQHASQQDALRSSSMATEGRRSVKLDHCHVGRDGQS